MSIVNSTIIEDRVQADGRRCVRERHVDHLGRAHDATYKAASGANVAAAMAARVVKIDAMLVERELNENEARALDGPFVGPTLQFCTAAQIRTRIRELYRTATAYGLCRLAWYIQRLSLTDNQLKTVFGVNDAQLPALKVKLAALEAKYIDVLDEAGD